MTLRSMLKPLLPADYREQVLGDLQERGFRLRDVVDVLPRIWGSFIVRTLTGPIPNVAAHGECAILARTEQLQQEGRRAIAYALAIVLATRVLRDLPASLTTRAALALVLFPLITTLGRFLGRTVESSLSLDRSRTTLLADYRAQLRFQMAGTPSGVLAAMLFLLTSDQPRTPWPVSTPAVWGYASVAVVGIMAAWACLRFLRLRRELNSLETAAKD